MPEALVNVYSPRSLTDAVNKIKTVRPFILNTFFKTSKHHGTDNIDVEIVTGYDHLAQFAGPNAGAKSIRKKTREIKQVTVPRTYEKKEFTAKELADWQDLRSSLYADNDAERIRVVNDMILEEVEDLKTRVVRRREQMACEAITTGKVTCNQDDLDFSLDFLFTAAHKFDLTGTDLWTDTTNSDPEVKVREWRRTINRKTGLQADKLVLGTDAAKAFLAHPKVQEALKRNNYRIGSIDLTKPVDAEIYLGKFAGVDVYEYSQQYTNESDVVTEMIAANRAIMGASQAKNKLHIAPAYRIGKGGKLEIHRVEYYLKPVVDDDGSLLMWKLEQKSLPAIFDPDAFITVKVV